MRYKLRPHHIDALVNRKKTTFDERKEIIKATTELYGSIGFATRKRDFIESVDGGTLVEVVLGNDYVCMELECPFSDKCREEDYQTVVDLLASRLAPGHVRDLVL
ncbi:MAG: hypothetical protein ABIA78_03445 [archaeon]